MDREELKACPFCGGDANCGTIEYNEFAAREVGDGKQRIYHFVNCRHCGVSNAGIVGHSAVQQAIATWNTRAAIEALNVGELIGAVNGLAELLACSVIGGVHFAVEPELSSVDMSFAKRSQAHAASSLLCALHPLDDDGCFIHKRPISEERVAELIELGNRLRINRKALESIRDE